MLVRISALRCISKMTAVDQPNNSTPFIAVIGPSNRHGSVGVMRRVLYECKIEEIGVGRRNIDDGIDQRPDTTSEVCAIIKTETVAVITMINSSHGCHVFLAPTVRATRTTAVVTSAWITIVQALTTAPPSN
jgi:hypothetical protein